MTAPKITQRRAALAARQLIYHERLSEWISRKTAENEAILESYLVISGEDKTVLLGGYVLKLADKDCGSPVEVSEPITEPECEQLEFVLDESRTVRGPRRSTG